MTNAPWSRISSEIPSDIVREDLSEYQSDWWALALLAKRRGAPLPRALGAVRPRDTQEASEVVALAAREGIPVVARGGGSGVCGGAQPVDGCLIVDLTGMNRIVGHDETSLVVHSEAGVLGPQIEDFLKSRGCTLGHFPQSFHLSTVGGWVSTKATGQLSTRYGGIEDRVIGLKVVLADGSVAEAVPQPRRSSGPDWWRLFLGAEGTLGLVTEVWLQAVPLPATHVWTGLRPDSFEAGLETLRRIVQSGLRPSVARLYDGPDAALNFGAIGISDPIAIFRFEGEPELVAAEKIVFDEIVAAAGWSTVSAQAGEHWWKRRFHATDAYREIMEGRGAFGPHAVVDTMEVSAVWSRLPGLYREVREALSNAADGVLAHASHLYTSGANIYFTFLISSATDDEEAERRYHVAWERGMEATLGAGGSISHHHGIGLLKAPWMDDELTSGMDVLRSVKAALDPRGTMNPGKVGL